MNEQIATLLSVGVGVIFAVATFVALGDVRRAAARRAETERAHAHITELKGNLHAIHYERNTWQNRAEIYMDERDAAIKRAEALAAQLDPAIVMLTDAAIAKEGGMMSDESNLPRCELCGEPMPEGETMFKVHGFSGPCPKPPLPRAAAIDWQASHRRALVRIAKLEEALRDLIDAATDLDITSYDYNAVLARAESALAKEGER